MRDDNAIIKVFEDAHGVKIDLTHYHFRTLPGRWNAVFLVVHAAGTDPAAWVEIDTETGEEKPVTAPEYYLRARDIAEDLYNEMMAGLDFTTIDDTIKFYDILAESYDDNTEMQHTPENEAEARARVERNRPDMEHSISECMMDAVEMFDIMSDPFPYCYIDSLILRNSNYNAIEDVVELHKKEIETAISNAHFIPEI